MPGIKWLALFQSAIGPCVPSYVKGIVHITTEKFCRPKQIWPTACWRLSMPGDHSRRLSLKIASEWEGILHGMDRHAPSASCALSGLVGCWSHIIARVDAIITSDLS